jgi:predicted MFS family arabinose efflux permease
MRKHLSWVRVLVSMTAAVTVSTLPVFLLGSAAPAIRTDLRLGSAHLGLIISAFWASMALGGLGTGQIAQRAGARTTTCLGLGTAAAAFLGLALSPSSMGLLLFASLAGIGCSLTTPAGDMAMLDVVPPERWGLAYGIKQASLPAASLLAGACTSLLTARWRWAFAIGMVVSLLAVITLPRREALDRRQRGAERGATVGSSGRLNDVIPIAIAVGLAMSGVAATGAFYVESAVTAGESARGAGVWLAFGSLCGIAGRFLFSWRLGPLARPYAVVAGLVGLGSLGVVVFALGGHGFVLLVGTILAFGAGWGWNGLLTQTVVASHAQAPARASAYLVVGAAAGGLIGPALFGAVVGHLGYRAAWYLCGALFMAAALVLLYCNWKAGRTFGQRKTVAAGVSRPPEQLR